MSATYRAVSVDRKMFLRVISSLLGLFLLAGCASTHRQTSPRATAFQFPADSMAYANQLKWEYYPNPEGGPMLHRKREPAPDYTLHCFVVARSVKQFFYHARFDPTLPKVSGSEYRTLAKKVVARTSRTPSHTSRRIVIPGYADLRSFSADHESMLKAECGGGWQSYVQRGHWRMLLPFSRSQQEKVEASLVQKLELGDAPVAHLVRFPQLSINHAVVLVGSEVRDGNRVFKVYD
ncbi:MAG TPA: hypothetical protein VK968_20355, partial [Roseimicrobium sp.]|nr:hypothetical protein [Roseimicrobium sp.]